MACGATLFIVATIAITLPFPQEATRDEGFHYAAITTMYGWLIPATIGAITLGIGFFLSSRRET